MAGPESRPLIAMAILLLASAAHAQTASPAASVQLAAANPGGALPSQRPEPVALLRSTQVSAAGESDTLLDVKVAGRFSLGVKSASGVALQLVDMITGPGEVAGAAGTRDGRIDLLLDKGTYKLHSSGAAGASGEATLSASPFREVEGASPALVRGGQVAATLADLQQRSYWIAVDKSRRVSVEAVGRALQDVRLWSDGTDLVDLTVSQTTIETKLGHPVTRARIDAEVEPGLYLVTAYGGVPLPWADGDQASPFYIRSGAPQILGGAFEGVIGPFGSARFQLSPATNHARVELPDPAPARLIVARGKGAAQFAAIAKESREPVASVDLASGGSDPVFAEVAGLEGQPYRLRALQRASSLRVDRSGLHLVAVDVAGEGGDELPATVVLAQFARGKAGVVLASDAPRVGPGQAWRRKFNLRSASTVLVEITGAGTVAARTEGPGVTLALDPLLGNTAPRSDGKQPLTWNVEAGWYVLRIMPIKDAVGILDLTFGQPGLDPGLTAAAAARTSIPLGIHNFDKGAYYEVFTNTAPRLVTGPIARALPAEIANVPLVVVQQPAAAVAPQVPVAPPVPPAAPAAPARKPATTKPSAQKPAPQKPAEIATPLVDPSRPLVIPVRVPLGGAIAVTGVDGKPIAATMSNEVSDKDGRTLIVSIPITSQARTVTFAWSKNEPDAPLPALVSAATLQPLESAKPNFLDLAQNGRRRFLLDVPEGGLYRIETLGRLKTTVAVATSYLPNLGSASDNGVGHNALLQTYLRAGSYRVSVAATDSSGHLGLVASPAPLPSTGLLIPGGSGRASLREGRGAIFPIDIAEAGSYRLDLYGLGRTLTARLEDAQGWPITKPGPMSRLERELAPGRYRLVVLPEDVDARVVARLTRIVPEAQLEGHGPHPLAFDNVQKFQWREPQGQNAPRDPDRWEFSLAGPANVVLETSDGMVADLLKLGGDGQPLAKIAYQRGFSGLLAAGRYAVEARSLGRNDRLDYELTLRSTEIQPGRPRFVDLPVTVPFALATDRVVSLTSFGGEDLSGILRDKDGNVLERLSGRTDDWNIALSRRLAAGSYQLELSGPKKTPAAAAKDDDSDSDANAPDSGNDAEEQGSVEIQFALPDVAEEPELSFAQARQVSGPQVHQIPLPAADAGGLVVVAAQSSEELVVSLERQDQTGRWIAAGFQRGRDAVIAVPADADTQRPWRFAVWAVDGGAAPITVSARAVRLPAQPLGSVSLAPLALDGIDRPIRIALVADPASGLVRFKQRPSNLSEGSKPGRVLTGTDGGILAPQSEQLWLVTRDATESVALEALPDSFGEIALTLAEGDVAAVPAPPSGHLRVWRADSTFGQPGVSAGRGMGVANGSALALAGGAALRIWNAGGGEPLRLRVAALDLETKAALPVAGEFSGVLMPRTAQPLALPPGAKKIEFNLAAGAAAMLDGGEARPVTVWGGTDAVTRTLAGDWTNAVLLDAGDKPAPVSLALSPAPAELDRLTAEAVAKQFFGAAGSKFLPLDARAGDRVVIAGAVGTFIGDGGRVIRGNTLVVPGPGDLVLDHAAGLVAAWIERDGKSPWPAVAARALAAPQNVRLDGQAMTFALTQDAPVLLHARTTAPVILSLSQGAAAADMQLFPAGAEFHRYVGAGKAELRLYSPHDGPLAGSLELTATPVVQIAEGLGDARAVAPGATALFGFEVTRAGNVGVGVRSEPDRAVVRLLDATGKPLGEGTAQLQRLDPGRYLIEARIPSDGRTTTVRPAVIGVAPPPAGPPPDVTLRYLEMVGLTPPRTP